MSPFDLHGSSSLRWSIPYPRLGEEVPTPLVVSGRLPSWFSSVNRRLVDVARAQPAWEQYGGQPLSAQDVHDALSFLADVMSETAPAPWIVPLNSGGLELTWRDGDVSLEVIFDRSRGERVLLASIGGEEYAADLGEAESLFQQAMERLAPAGQDDPILA